MSLFFSLKEKIKKKVKNKVSIFKVKIYFGESFLALRKIFEETIERLINGIFSLI